MTNESWEVTVFETTAAELRSVPIAHVGFLLASSLSANELTLNLNLHRLAENTVPITKHDPWLIQLASSNRFVLLRRISSILYEYFVALRAYHRTCSRKAISDMDVFFDQWLPEIEKLKDNSLFEIVKFLRNQTTNHYNSIILQKLIKDGDLGPDEHPFHFILNEHHGNCYYLIAEQLLINKFGQNVDDQVEKFAEFDAWVMHASAIALEIHSSFAQIIAGKYFRNKNGDSIELPTNELTVREMAEVNLPVFWRFI